MKNLKKLLAIMLAVIMVVSVFAACAKKPSDQKPTETATTTPGAGDETKEPEPVTLKILGHSGILETSEAVKSAIEKFKSTYPHITLELTAIGSNEYNDKRAIMIAGGEQIDAMAVSNPLDTLNLAQSGMILPLNEYAEATGLKPEDILSEDIIRMEDIGGKIYKLPYTTTAWLLFYNKDIFDAAGVPYPDPKKAMTWSEFRETAKKLTKGSGADKIYGAFQLVWPQYWYTYAISSLGGGEAFYTEDGKSNITHPKFAEALKFNYDMQFEDKSLIEYFEVKMQKLAVPSFATGKYGMFYTGSFAINTLANQDLQFKLGIAPMPIPDDAPENYRYTFGGSTGFAIPRTAKHHNEAYTFAYEMVKNFAEVADNIPAYKSDDTIDRICQIFADKYPGHDLAPELWKDLLFGEQDFISEKITGPASGEYETIVIEEMEKYYTNAQSLEDTIKNIEKRANEAIENYNAANN